nr:hypothetical protein [Escherichia coli]
MESRTEGSEGGYAAKALAGAKPARIIRRPKGNGRCPRNGPRQRAA